MSAAAAVIGRLLVPGTVVVIQDQVFALVSDNVRYSLQVAGVFGDHECGRAVRYDHSGGVDVAALVVCRAGVLSRSDGDVRRIISGAVFIAIRLRDKYRVIRVIQITCVAVLAGDGEKIGEPAVDRG